MDLRTMLNNVAALEYDPALGGSQPAQVHLHQVRKELGALLPPTGLKVRVSGTAVNLPAIPWIAVLDPEVTTTAQSGLYVVYLFDARLERVYLTMNQGATAHQAHARQSRPPGSTVDSAAITELEAESAAIRGQLPDSLVASFPQEIDLAGSKFLPKAYEAGSIAAAPYNLATLPDENHLRRDLLHFLRIYDAAVEARKALTAARPDLFHSPAVASPPGPPGAENELFRPKDASDYVAHVAAHTQVRTRRHEAVVKSFGEHATARGWTPATNVHPRDLTLTRGTEHVLCEVKVVKANAEGAVREAIGQLLSYRHFLYPTTPPDALLAVFSDAPGAAFVDLLTQLGIASVWPVANGGWAGSDQAHQWNLADAPDQGPLQ